MNKTFKMGKMKLSVLLEKYSNGSICLTALTSDGEEWLTLSTNLDSSKQGEDKIFVKFDESYNELAQAMCGAGLLSPMYFEDRSGYNSYWLYMIMPKCFEIADKQY